MADFYYPTNSSKITHAIVLIHGGSVQFGRIYIEKETTTGLIPFLREAFPTVLIVNMEYYQGNINSPGYPQQLSDVTQLLEFIKKKENNPKLTFALFGVSSGAHLALLYAYKWDTEKKDVRVVVDLLGATDLSSTIYSGNPLFSFLLTGFLGAFPSWELLNEASPVNWVTRDLSTKTLGFYGVNDLFVPASQGRRLKAKLEEMGVENEFTFFQGSHFVMRNEDRKDMEQKIVAFLRKHFI